MSSNTITLTGFTSKDGAELRFTQGGAAVVNFRMTGTHQRWDRDQSKHVDQGDPLWLGVTCWHELAVQVAEQIGQGTSRLVTVTGHLQRRSWQTPEGETRTADEVTAASVCVHPPRDGQPAQRQQQAAEPQGWGQPAQQTQGNPWGGQTSEPAPF